MAIGALQFTGVYRCKEILESVVIVESALVLMLSADRKITEKLPEGQDSVVVLVREITGGDEL